MSTEVTTEMMNEVIRQFIGLEPYEDSRYGTLYSSPVDGKTCFSLQYHTSWDWLIPVIQKIKGMHLDILKQAYVMEYMKAAAHMNSGLLSLKIEEAHLGVYKFLTWYNQQKQTNDKK